MSNVRFIGLDVHVETIAVAVAEPDGEVRSLGVIPNRPASIQLPTDHDYAVPTREYQSDQASRQPTRPPPMLRSLTRRRRRQERTR
jgi:hypothetical protein